MKKLKEDILDELIRKKIVAVIRIDQSADLVDVSKALIDGGVTFVEITTTVPNALQAIERTASCLGNDIQIGAGTILSSQQAVAAIDAGASYIISPILDSEIILTCKKADVAVMPGCMTPTEVFNGWMCGADVVKIFPADLGGPVYFKNLKGPFPDIRIMPTGNVNLNNAVEFLNAGACALGVGGALVSKDLIMKKQYSKITENARTFVSLVAQR